MTNFLEKAIETLSNESIETQDRIASIILDELLTEREWEATFTKNKNTLQQMAKNALTEIQAGEFEDGGFDNL